MTDGVSFNIKGIEGIEIALRNVPKKLARKVVFDSLKAGARLMQKEAKAGAPKRTGRLRRAIKVKQSKLLTDKNRGQYAVYLKIDPGKKRDDQRGAYYGNIVDGGYVSRGVRLKNTSSLRAQFGKRSGRKTTPGRKIQGKHFMQRAYKNKARMATNLIIKSMERGIKIITKQEGLGYGK